VSLLALHRTSLAWSYGIVCHVLFAVGVGSMIMVMFTGMTASLGSVGPPGSYVANALLLLQFPLLHSLLLTRRGSRALSLLAPGGLGSALATTTYGAVASAQVGLLFLAWTPSGIVWWTAHGFAFGLLTALYLSSWLLLGKAIIDAGFAYQVGLLGWRAVALNVPVKYPPMPTRGLFRLCRQPIYVAFALTLWTVPVWTPDQLAVSVVLSIYCLAGPLLKERRFAGRFGAAFHDYRSRTPYWLPWPRPRPLTNREPDQKVYDDVAGRWWSGEVRWLRVLQGLTPVRLRLFAPVVGDWKDKDVLDLGCGGGFLAEALACAGARVTGIDPSGPAIDAARAHACSQGLDIAYAIGTGEAIPNSDHSFDVVACVDVLEHVHDLRAVVGEVARVLRPGGLFLFDTINRTALARFVIVSLGEKVVRLLPPGTHEPGKFIRPDELGHLLAEAGLDMAPVIGLGPRWITRRFDLVFGRVPTTGVLYLGYARRNRPNIERSDERRTDRD
jgi:ubiquinone biosynthesis O-methyltransferase